MSAQLKPQMSTRKIIEHLERAMHDIEAARTDCQRRSMDAGRDVHARMAYGHQAHRMRDLLHRLRLTLSEVIEE